MSAAGQFITAKLMRTTYETPWGFRLQGGQEFQMPLSVVKVAEGSLAEQAGVQVGDIILKINGKECDKMRHKEAQDAILEAGNYLELYLERGQMNTWQPTVTPVGSMDMRNKSGSAEPQTYTRTSLAKNPEESAPIGSGHNVVPKPFNAPKLVHKQFNSPINLYSEKSLEETLNAHTQVLSTGVQGINFMRPDAPVNKDSAVFQMVQEEEARKAKGFSGSPDKNGFPMDSMAPAAASMDGSMVGGAGGGAGGGAPIKHVQAPSGGPSPQRQDERNRNICAHCERLIVGVFCRVNNKSFHAECFVCATCGTSLKNIGYFQINDKLYCDIHARQIRQVLGADASGGGGQLPQPQPQPMGSLGGGYPNQAPPFGGGGGAASAGFNATAAAAAAGPIGGGGFNRQFSPSSASAAAAPSASPYQPTATTNGFQSFSSQGPKKFSPVAPPTAPKPFSPNRNSMCVDLPSTYNFSSSSQETRSTEVQNQNYNAPPAGPAMSNPAANFVSLTIGRRQPQSMATMSQNRPQSCYSSLPSNAYSVTTNTYQTTRTTTNYPTVGGGGPGGFKTNMANPNLTYPPQTATYASRTQTTYSMPNQQSGHPINSLPSQPPAASSYGAAAAPSAGYPASGAMLGRPVQPTPSLSSNPVASNFGKPTSMNDSTKSTAPKRGKGFLQNQLSGGVIPYCGYCSQPIRGQYIMALNKTWCPNHFICANSMCKLSLEQNGFVEEQGRLYCENCYETHFAPTCTKCSLRIKGDCLNALDKKWHPECFTCTHCRRPFGNSSFYLEDAYPYCEKDWNDLFTTKCVGCSLPIAAGDRWVEALNQNYHSNCFRCTVCHNNLEGQSFFAKGGRPFCKAHAR